MTTTATVEPAIETMEPMQRDRMNWARNTMQDTMAMSVPIPRTCVHVARVGSGHLVMAEELLGVPRLAALLVLLDVAQQGPDLPGQVQCGRWWTST
jgi:hypothetical protein